MSADYTTPWAERIKKANKYHEDWSNKYHCAQLEDYYRGFQRPGLPQEDQLNGYTLNMIMATIEIKMASLSFQNIQYQVSPKPSRADFNLELAVQTAQLKEDVLNTLVQNPNGLFCEEVEAALKDSYFRFGVLEVGYSADWIDNPNAGKPLHLTDIDASAQNDSEEPTVLKEPAAIPTNEQIYFKRIPAARFRVGGIEGRYLHQCNWYGYYDFYYADDIKSAKQLQNTDKITAVSHRSADWIGDAGSGEFDDLLKQGDLLKLYTIYDNRAKQILLYDPSNDVILFQKPFKRTGIFDIRWYRDVFGWYPIPPVFNWISPQNEMNESRQQMRSYRRRFVSQQYAIEGQVDQEEIDKYEEGKDGSVIKIKREGAIGAIQKDTLTGTVPQAMIVGKDDFVLMAGTSSESMGQADRITATQSIEIAKRFGVREAREKIKVANWVERIGREALLMAQEKLISGLFVKSQRDPGESIMGEVQLNPQVYQYVMMQDIQDGVDFDIVLHMTSMSPLDNDTEKTKFIEFLSVLKQFPEIAMSPLLIREAAYRIGYRNEKVIRELQTTSLLSSLGQMSMGTQGQQNPQSGAAQQIVQSATPPTTEEVRNQLDNQLVQ